MAYEPNAVLGPSSATSGNIPIFSGATGKLVGDSGQSVASILSTASSATDTKLASYVTTTALTTTLLSYVPTSRTLTVPIGMTIGGTPNTSADLSANRTLGFNFATQAEAQAGTDTMKPMNAARVLDAINYRTPGKNQTIQDLTASRSLGTVYQNPYNVNIEVSVLISASGSANLVAYKDYVDGSTTWAYASVPVAGGNAHVQMTVPPLGFYKVTSDASVTLVFWKEERA